MSTRKIIEIDEALCNGCGDCVTGCAEGALAIVDGKARLVRENYCDGFGDCIGACPTGALRIVEREAEAFNEDATREYLRRTQGESAVHRMDEAAVAHARKQAGAHMSSAAEAGTTPPASQCETPSAEQSAGGCPGSRMRMMPGAAGTPAAPVTTGAGLPERVQTPELRQWPVQLHLVPVGAPWFAGRDLVVMSTCAPLASADVHWRFLRGRSVVVACPKLDRTDTYVAKLAQILSGSSIPRVLVVRMEVPCCGGLSQIVRQAAATSGRADIALDEVIVGIDGGVKRINAMKV